MKLVTHRQLLRQRGLAALDADEGQGLEELLEVLVARLHAAGAPQGVWLVEIARVRAALRDADSLLLKMQNAILAELPPLSD